MQIAWEETNRLFLGRSATASVNLVAGPGNTTVPNGANTFATAVTVNGLTYTIPAGMNGPWLALGEWEFFGSVTGWATAFGSISMAGAQVGSCVWRDTGAAIQDVTLGTFATRVLAAGDIVKLVAFKTANAGTLVIGAGVSAMTLVPLFT